MIIDSLSVNRVPNNTFFKCHWNDKLSNKLLTINIRENQN